VTETPHIEELSLFFKIEEKNKKGIEQSGSWFWWYEIHVYSRMLNVSTTWSCEK